MITATSQRRRAYLLWGIAGSLALHAIGAYFFRGFRHDEIVPYGAPEVTIVDVRRPVVTPPSPPPPAPRHHTEQQRVTAGGAPRHELARQVATAPPQPPQRPHAVAPQISRDQTSFAREVAALNKQNDPHAIPTIDPGSQISATKSYSFASTSLAGGERGNGYIYPTQKWRDRGEDCYYGRYQYTYPDGGEEDGTIVWPFCYDPVADPFLRPPHPMPFPLPLPGYVLPPGTTIPPIERSVYNDWVRDH